MKAKKCQTRSMPTSDALRSVTSRFGNGSASIPIPISTQRRPMIWACSDCSSAVQASPVGHAFAECDGVCADAAWIAYGVATAGSRSHSHGRTVILVGEVRTGQVLV
eukprot:TRINITY_DN10991_c0_g1_i2.p2 TRINITY_DN10991_c0_g1~~TRINITY_DN10991_c0_g1_i2.p2  ORF type:complete len:107 (+),score=3.99 TRINITY_DN10991_c0_g1_i2:136-456(+)